jgi:long-chain acyl-CoA synthetase
VVPIPAGSPVEAVCSLLAAELLGAVPVLAADLAPTSDAAPTSHAAPASEPAPSGSDPAPSAPGLMARAADLYRTDGDAEPLLVVVTSGTSGHPRAVVRTALSWQGCLAGFDTLLAGACEPGEVMWAPGGVASTLTLFALWHALATGRSVIASGQWRRGSAAPAGAAATAVQCVPAVLWDVLDARASGQLPSLRRAIVAGAALSGELRRRAAALGLELVEYYGAAELSFVAADPDGRGLRPFPGAELSIRDGVIWVRSPYLARGYLDPGDGGPLRRDAAGWASVGDRGELSPDGVLTVRGRGDDTASVAGHTVILDDVERALAGVQGVAEVVCVAVPDRRFGQRIHGAVRPVAGTTPSDVVNRLRAAARERLQPAARPARYVLREELPRTPGGKVARSVLAAELAGDRTLPA